MPAIISGNVFDDLNHNGIIDPGEPGIPNAFVYLQLQPGGSCIPTQTDINGDYSFTNINTAGTYTVFETIADNGATCPPTTFTQPTGFNGSTTNRKLNVTVTASDISGDVDISGNNFGHDNLPAFDCQPFAYQAAVSGGSTSNLFRIDLKTGTTTNQGDLGVNLNSMGYSAIDGNIYGRVSNNRIGRLNADNTVTLLPVTPNLPTTSTPPGDVDPNGYLYLITGGVLYVVDVNPNRSTYGLLVDPTNSFQEDTTPPFGINIGINGGDLAFNPQDGQIYIVIGNGTVNRINPLTGAVTALTTNPLVSGAYGAQFFDNYNNLYVIDNNSGVISRYAISGNTATRTFFANGQSASGNDGARCATAPIDFAFIETSKSATTEVGVGETITYTIVLNNIGNTTADTVTFVDTIPNGTTFNPGSITLDGSPIAGDPSPPSGVNLGSLSVGLHTVTFTVTATTIPSPNPTPNVASGTYQFLDNAAPTPPTFTEGYNTNVASTTINFAILLPFKSVDRDFSDINETLTYTIVYTNTGNVTANNIVFIDTIPNDTTFISNSLTQDGVLVAGSPNPPGLLLPNSISPGATSTITFQVTVDTIPSPNPIPNTSSATFTYTGDPSIPNGLTGNSNSNTVDTLVLHANLGNITKFVDKAFADCNETITYTIEIPNTGNTTALNIVFTDTIPNGTTFITNSVTLNGISQPGTNPQNGINIGAITPGNTSTITFQIQINC